MAIVQARLGSERLPGKVLAEVRGQPLLGFLLDQLSFAKSLDEVVVAVPAGAKDEPIVQYCASRSILCVAGSEEDVLARYVVAADACDAATVLRITADCPLLDPGTVDRNVAAHFAGGCAYTVNEVPERIPRGYDVEVMDRATLSRLDALSTRPEEREHVTFHIERHPELFTVHRFHDAAFPAFPAARLCVDTQEDFTLVSRVLEAAWEPGQPLAPEVVLAVLVEEPELIAINATVRQKEV